MKRKEVKLLSADFTPEALPILNWNLMCVKQMSESLQCGATNKNAMLLQQ